MSLKRFVAMSLVAVMALAMSSGLAVAAEKPQGPAAKVNINTATAEQLTQLPGVGEKLAARIVEHRQKEGPFRSAQELMNVRGIGEKNFQKLEAYLTVGDPARSGAGR